MVIISLPNLPNGWKCSMLLQYVNFGLILYRNLHYSFNRLNVFDYILKHVLYKLIIFLESTSSTYGVHGLYMVWLIEEGGWGLGVSGGSHLLV